MNKQSVIGSIAAAFTYAVYGVNVVLCKDLVCCNAFTPTLLLVIRTMGAAILFWTISIFTPREHVEAKDLLKIYAASLLSMTIPQAAMLWGIKTTTPFDASMVNTLKPLFAIFASLLVFGKGVGGKTWLGVAVAMAGAVLLVISGQNVPDGLTSSPTGIGLMCINGLSFAFYLALFNTFIKKYSIITFMKWCTLFACLTLLPFSLQDISSVNLEIMNMKRYGELAFLTIGATFLTYLTGPAGQKRLSPTQYYIMSYIQPLTTAVISVMAGTDIITPVKLLACGIMITGVLTVSNVKSKNS